MTISFLITETKFVILIGWLIVYGEIRIRSGSLGIDSLSTAQRLQHTIFVNSVRFCVVHTDIKISFFRPDNSHDSAESLTIFNLFSWSHDEVS